ncbi:right-handed parallel beta-helix repeat-containing protein [Streptomyces sp. ME02-8801-2C]|uniref:right-handed parallel beta-helix repeat-containing protein n=1 Tax=Streptomyces sp. ME02-8801-2C TaxID=3028680 RepID=UPI0029B8D692|nr:right-handed parallel beta-helix repeat-containing protein [Streptomyces sp. ME02-8801-2C]MDX3458488.1 right-handed parallel beta-helix repeat-containing protein [Streptomyces sp. ME02-8801-2C]
MAKPVLSAMPSVGRLAASAATALILTAAPVTVPSALADDATALGADGAAAHSVATDLTWSPITFGQSTDLNFASNVLPEKVGTNYAKSDHPGTLEGRTVLESRGGKLAPGHDGITFYQTVLNPKTDNFVLTADMTVEQFGPETGAAVNSADSAGIMVRDVNGAARQEPMVTGFEEVPAASNVFGAGMMKTGLSGFSRTGVVKPYGNPGGALKAIPFTKDSKYALPTGTPVTLRLERTDTEFVMSATFTHAGEPATFEQRVAGADWVQDIDPDHMYVGLYAARNAKVSFDNARLEVSEAHTQPRTPVQVPPVAPALTLFSAPETSTRDYTIRARPNYDGTLVVTDTGSGERIAEARVAANEIFGHDVRLASDQADFELTFTPDAASSPGTPVSRSLKVVRKAYGEKGDGCVVHASPGGTGAGAGTVSDPVDLATALKYVAPGGEVLMHDGTYQPTGTLNLGASYSGLDRKPKTLKPYRNQSVVIDGRDALDVVLRLDADNWRVRGFHITHAQANAMRVSGSHNTIERMLFNYNGNTGFQITGSGSDPALWPSYNLVQGNESHDNRDLDDENADGFAAKLGVGAGNVFRGNIAHHNIDDGWDLYNRTNEGANLPITLVDNIAYANGRLSNGYDEDSNRGSGFKLGGEGLPVDHVVRGNIAYDNNLDGFTDNFNPGRMTLTGNTSFDNKRFNYIARFNPYFTAAEQGVYRDNLSFRTEDGPGGAEPVRDFLSGDVDRTNVLFDGERAVSSDGTTVATTADFYSLTPPASYERNRDGTPRHGAFLRPTRHSPLNTAGTGGSAVGALSSRH